MSLSGNVKHYRELMNLSRAELGDLVGKSEHTIKKYELGEVSPTYDVIGSIAAALKVEMIDLLGLSKKQKPKPTDLGESIKYHRELKSLTQTELASLISKSLRMVRKYELNEVEPSLKMIKLISETLDVDALELLEPYFKNK